MYYDIKHIFISNPIGQISSNTIEISKICNPNYITNGTKLNCDEVFRRGQCENLTVKQHLRDALKNTDGLWETRLNCPQCGCGIDALDLNEIAKNEGWRTTEAPTTEVPTTEVQTTSTDTWTYTKYGDDECLWCFG